MATFHGIPSDDIEQLSEPQIFSNLPAILALNADAFLHFLRNVVHSTALLPWDQRYISITILRAPYHSDSYKEILNVEPIIFPRLFPKLNRHVRILVQGAAGVWAAHELVTFKPEPPIAKLINNLDFKGYADDDSRLYKAEDWRMWVDPENAPLEGE